MTLGMHAVGNKRVFWTPKDLGSALTFWIDASDSSTVTLTSSKVSQIDDKSGNNRNASQATAANQPVIDSAVQNNRDALRFYADGSTDYLDLSSTGISSQPYTFFAACRFNYTLVSEVIIFNSAGRAMQDEQGTARLSLFAGSVFLSTAGNSEAWMVYGGIFNGSSSLISANGTTYTGNPGSGAWNGATTRIGQRTDATDNGLRGWIGELMIVNSAVSAANRQRLEGWLAHRWGLTGNLPANHPYKTALP